MQAKILAYISIYVPSPGAGKKITFLVPRAKTNMMKFAILPRTCRIHNAITNESTNIFHLYQKKIFIYFLRISSESFVYLHISDIFLHIFHIFLRIFLMFLHMKEKSPKILQVLEPT